MSGPSQALPTVSIGLPVYNGADFVAGSIRSILAQTYRDFELVISDNASTDATEEICRSFAARDPRIRYIRQPVNKGAAWNFNEVVHQSRGRYFRWAAHDDLTAPRFLERCVDILEADAGCVLAHPATIFIDEDGREQLCYLDYMASDSDDPVQRFRTMMAPGICRTNPVYGLIRREIIARTGLLGSYVGSGHVFLGEVAILGRTTMVHETLFFRRMHAKNSTNSDNLTLSEWYHGVRGRGLRFKKLRLVREFARIIGRPELGLSRRQKLGCYLVLLNWIRTMRGGIRRELLIPLYTNGRPTALNLWLSSRFKRWLARPEPDDERLARQDGRG